MIKAFCVCRSTLCSLCPMLSLCILVVECNQLKIFLCSRYQNIWSDHLPKIYSETCTCELFRMKMNWCLISNTVRKTEGQDRSAKLVESWCGRRNSFTGFPGDNFWTDKNSRLFSFSCQFYAHSDCYHWLKIDLGFPHMSKHRVWSWHRYTISDGWFSPDNSASTSSSLGCPFRSLINITTTFIVMQHRVTWRHRWHHQ